MNDKKRFTLKSVNSLPDVLYLTTEAQAELSYALMTKSRKLQLVCTPIAITVNCTLC